MGGCFVIFLKSIKGIFLQKRGWVCFCHIRKLPGYFFKVEGVGGGERHDFRKPIIYVPLIRKLTSHSELMITDKTD